MRAFEVSAWRGAALERRGVAAEDGTLVLTVGAAPGEAFSVSARETRELGG